MAKRYHATRQRLIAHDPNNPVLNRQGALPKPPFAPVPDAFSRLVQRNWDRFNNLDGDCLPRSQHPPSEARKSLASSHLEARDEEPSFEPQHEKRDQKGSNQTISMLETAAQTHSSSASNAALTQSESGHGYRPEAFATTSPTDSQVGSPKESKPSDNIKGAGSLDVPSTRFSKTASNQEKPGSPKSQPGFLVRRCQVTSTFRKWKIDASVRRLCLLSLAEDKSEPERSDDSAAIHHSLDELLDAYRASPEQSVAATSSPSELGILSRSGLRSRSSIPAGTKAKRIFINTPSVFDGSKSTARSQHSQRFASTRATPSSNIGDLDPANVKPQTFRSLSPQTSHVLNASIEDEARPTFVRGSSLLQHEVGGQDVREHLRLWQAWQADDLNRNLVAPSSERENALTQTGAIDTSIVDFEEDVADDLPAPEIDPEEGTPSILHAPKFFRQGDLVEVWNATDSILTIFIRNYANHSLFYSENGSWLVRRSKVARFALPGFVSPSDLEDVLPFSPAPESLDNLVDRLTPLAETAPRDAGRKALQRMQRFRQSSNDIYRKYGDRINSVYQIMASPSFSDGPKTMSIGEIAIKVFGKESIKAVTPEMIWTLHRRLCKTQNVSTDDLSHRLTPVFTFLPRQNLQHITKVEKWMREFQESSVEKQIEQGKDNGPSNPTKMPTNPIASFVLKAKHAIIASRQARPISPTGIVGPRVKEDGISSEMEIFKATPMQELDTNERMVLHYLDAWVTSKSLSKHNNLRALGPMVLRAIGMYEKLDLDESAGYTLLQELGIISPWQNPTLYIEHFNLPGRNPHEPLSVLAREAQSQLPTFKKRDAMAEFRKDWGDLPAYCIDSADTLERDDAISVEEVEGESSAWVHIHVANPSAFITPDSVFGQYAAELVQSLYLPEAKYPMLQLELSLKHLSLGQDRPCITFSAKLDTAGNILEHRISHGILHNVVFMTPEKVLEVAGFGEQQVDWTSNLLTIGERPLDENAGSTASAEASSRPLTPEDVRKLQSLGSLGKATRERRERAGATRMPRQEGLMRTCQPNVTFGDIANKLVAPLSNRIQRYDNDPVVSLESRPKLAAFNFLSDLMVLAGEVCANWCVDRKLPVPYRGIRINPEPAVSPAEFKHEMTKSAIAEGRDPSIDEIRTHMMLLGSADCSSSPLRHPALGIPAYVKATSPLRRYGDLMAHWQIEAAIRNERRTGLIVQEEPDLSFLPFSTDQVESSCKKLMARGGQILRIERNAIGFWSTWAIARAFYFNQAELPETFQIHIYNPVNAANIARGVVVGWDRRALLQDKASLTMPHGGLQVDDVWEAKITKIMLYRKEITFEPVRLVSKGNATA